MRLALTGATGFVGSTVLELALERGHTIVALTRREQSPREGVDWISGDLANKVALARLVAGADAVIHVAGVVNAQDKPGFEAGNIHGTEAMVNAAHTAGVSRFVHVSSLAAREPHLSDYGASKLAAEKRVRDSGMDAMIVRPPAIYGPRDTEMLELFRMAKRGVVPLPPKGRASMIHVGDLARLLLAMAEHADEHYGALYEADDGHEAGWSHDEVAHLIGEAVGRQVLPLHVPRGMMLLAARADRMIRGDRAKLTLDRAGYMAHPDWVVRSILRPPVSLWHPVIGLREGLRDTAGWYRREGWL